MPALNLENRINNTGRDDQYNSFHCYLSQHEALDLQNVRILQYDLDFIGCNEF